MKKAIVYTILMAGMIGLVGCQQTPQKIDITSDPTPPSGLPQELTE